MPTVLKSGSLKLLEPSGPVQACNGIALPFTNFSYNTVSTGRTAKAASGSQFQNRAQSDVLDLLELVQRASLPPFRIRRNWRKEDERCLPTQATN